MSNSIKLSPNHGVNPCIPICFWCGEEKSEVAMLGKIDKQDSAAPMKAVLNYEPCDKCKELFSAGIHVIGVTEQRPVEGMFPISKTENGADLFPTGAMFVATEDWVNRMFDKPEMAHMKENVLRDRVLLLPSEIVDDIVKESRAAEEVEETENENN